MKRIHLLLLGLLVLLPAACTQPTAAPSATLPPPTRTQPAPADTVTPPPVPPTVTTTPSPVPSDTLTSLPTATLEVICPEAESSSATTLAIQGMILFEKTEGSGADYKDTIYGMTALSMEPQPVFDTLPQGVFGEFRVSFDGKWLAVRHDDVLMIANTQEQITLPWEYGNWSYFMGSWLADNQRLVMDPLYEDDDYVHDEIFILNPFTGYQELFAPELPYPEGSYGLIDAFGPTAYYDPTLTRVAYKISEYILVLWDLEEGRELWRLVEPNLMLRERAFWSPDGNFMAVTNVIGDHTTPIWLDENVSFQALLIDRTGEVVWQDPYPYNEWGQASMRFTWSPNGRYLALYRESTDGNHARTLILDTTSMEVLDYCITSYSTKDVIWSPDSQQFIAWDVLQGTPLSEDGVFQNILVDLSRDMVVRLEGISLEPVAWIDTEP